MKNLLQQAPLLDVGIVTVVSLSYTEREDARMAATCWLWEWSFANLCWTDAARVVAWASLPACMHPRGDGCASFDIAWRSPWSLDAHDTTLLISIIIVWC